MNVGSLLTPRTRGRRFHLHALRSQSEGCHNSARVSNSARSDDREPHGIDDLRTNAIVPVRESSDGCRKEPRWPPASKPELQSRPTRLFQGNRFVYGGRRPNQRDSLTTELIQNLFRGNAVDNAEYEILRPG